MAPFSRVLQRIEPLRLSALLVGLPVVLFLGAFAYASTTSQPYVENIAAVAAVLVVTGTGLLYAWRLGAGGLVD